MNVRGHLPGAMSLPMDCSDIDWSEPPVEKTAERTNDVRAEPTKTRSDSNVRYTSQSARIKPQGRWSPRRKYQAIRSAESR
jgi:hypothetical protein